LINNNSNHICRAPQALLGTAYSDFFIAQWPGWLLKTLWFV